MQRSFEIGRKLAGQPLAKPTRLAWLAAILFCIALFGVTGWRVWQAHDVELAESRITTANLARAVADQAQGTIRDASIVLAGLAERLEVDGAADASLARLHRLMTAHVAAIPTIHHLVVFSAGGDALTASFEPMPPVNVADRSYFTYHRDHPAAGEMIGPAVRNRADGRWSLMVSRRVEGPGGGFGGVVVAVVDCATFLNFYTSLDVGPHGAIALAHEDRTIVVRYPEPPDPDYRNTAAVRDYWATKEGGGRYVSPLDGVARLYSFQRIAGAPLVAIVAMSQADVLGNWRRDSGVALAVCSAVSAVLGLLGWALARLIRRGEQREAALERSEQQYRLLAEHSTDVIIQLGPDSCSQYVSPACERVFGYRQDEMLFGHARGCTHPEDWPAVQATIAEILQNGRAPPVTYRSRRKDGSYIWVETQGQKVEGSDGYIVAIREATHRKQAEARLLEEIAAREAAQAQLAHARRLEALGQLAGGVAHDFNNVLQAVQGGARLIAERPDDTDAVRRFVRIISQAAARGTSVTKRLLAFARQDALQAEAVDPAALLAGMVEILEPTLHNAIRIVARAEPGLPPLLADKGQLETVLVNLATNARDAMPAGGTLTFTAALHETGCQTNPRHATQPGPASAAEERYVRITASDTGSGIEPDVLARVAEPFFTTKPAGQGTGLGLAMAKGFAEQSGGGLSIESTLGRGTAVALWLPITADRGSGTLIETPSPPGRAPNPADAAQPFLLS